MQNFLGKVEKIFLIIRNITISILDHSVELKIPGLSSPVVRKRVTK